MAKIGVLGAGMMGSALSVPLADAQHDIVTVGTPLDAKIVTALREGKPHPGLGVPLPNVQARPWEEAAPALADRDGIVIGVSSAGIDFAARAVKELGLSKKPLVLVTKGLRFRDGEFRLMPDIVSGASGADSHGAPASICGPCIAGELARRVPTTVVISGRDPATVDRWASWLGTSYYRLVASADLIGSQVCAALKNAYAMGLAFADGLHQRSSGRPGSLALHNYEAAVFAQALEEMRELTVLAGGNAETAAGLAGAGDLLVTTSGGRTSRLGRALGLGLGRTEAVRRMQGATLEALEVLEVMRAASAELRARGRLAPEALPLLRHLMEVLLDDRDVAVPFEHFFRRA
ncbi:MAG TPA: hypothetical protein VF989_17960 [Polyangiaceae bacterium]